MSSDTAEREMLKRNYEDESKHFNSTYDPLGQTYEGAGGPGAWMAGFGAARAGLEEATASSVAGTWLELALTVVSLLVCSVWKTLGR